MTAYYPAWVTDLLKYQLLLLRTSQQFSGSAWLSYDRAFRRQAAAYKLSDWSHLNPELFHFHVSGAAAAEHPAASPPVQSVSPARPSRPVDVHAMPLLERWLLLVAIFTLSFSPFV